MKKEGRKYETPSCFFPRRTHKKTRWLTRNMPLAHAVDATAEFHMYDALRTPAVSHVLSNLAETNFIAHIADRCQFLEDAFGAVKELCPNVQVGHMMMRKTVMLSLLSRDLPVGAYQAFRTELTRMRLFERQTSTHVHDHLVTLVTSDAADLQHLFGVLRHRLTKIIGAHVQVDVLQRLIETAALAAEIPEKWKLHGVHIGTDAPPDAYVSERSGRSDAFVHNSLAKGIERDARLMEVATAPHPYVRTLVTRGLRTADQHHIRLEIPVHFLCTAPSGKKYAYRVMLCLVRLTVIHPDDPEYQLPATPYTLRPTLKLPLLTLQSMAKCYFVLPNRPLDENTVLSGVFFAVFAYLYEGQDTRPLPEKLLCLDRWDLGASPHETAAAKKAAHSTRDPWLERVSTWMHGVRTKLAEATEDAVDEGRHPLHRAYVPTSRKQKKLPEATKAYYKTHGYKAHHIVLKDGVPHAPPVHALRLNARRVLSILTDAMWTGHGLTGMGLSEPTFLSPSVVEDAH